MIKLFNIPNYIIDTSKFSNLVNGDNVQEFTQNFCKYTGFKYGCPVNSATNAIIMIAFLVNDPNFKIPSIIPPVVLNAIVLGGQKYKFTDHIDWVGHPYVMSITDKMAIIDSAQEVRRSFGQRCLKNDLVIYSFFPTKPIGSCDGGMICSNNQELIKQLTILSNNGMCQSENSWNKHIECIGWKFYMNSIQAYIANENLKRLDEKREKLDKIRNIYNNELEISDQTSYHLYRIKVTNNKQFLVYMKENGIICGIHYRCLHTLPTYQLEEYPKLPKSEFISTHTASIPFHEELTELEILKVIKCVKSSGMKIE